jgi:hypothetical protein
MTRLRRRLWTTYVVVFIQKVTRLALRVAWLTAGIYLALYCAEQLWAYAPGTQTRLLLLSAPALLALIALFLPWPRPTRLAWRLDRLYELREQVSTGWEVSSRDDTGQLEALLVADAAALMPRVTWRILWRGWAIMPDLLSLLTVAVLYVLVFGASWTLTPVQLPETEVARLPAPGRDPTMEDVLPSGIPGVEAPMQAASNGTDDPAQGEQTRSPATDEALRQLGESLANQAATHDAGQALQQGDLQGAADEMESLADRADALSAETREEMASAFEEAAQNIGQEGVPEEQQLAQEMSELAEQLSREGDLDAREQMDDVAEALRQLEETTQMADGKVPIPEAGALTDGSDPQASDPQPFERLQGQGQTVSLGSESDESGMLRPGTQGEAGTSITGGAFSDSGRDGVVGSGVLTPYQYPWTLRDVVSEYFSP